MSETAIARRKTPIAFALGGIARLYAPPMAGLYFGTSRWDDIPQTTFGLTVDNGFMSGVWQGVPVEAYFTNRFDRDTESYDHVTCLKAELDPPLGLHGLENGEAMNRIVDTPFRADVEARGN